MIYKVLDNNLLIKMNPPPHSSICNNMNIINMTTELINLRKSTVVSNDGHSHHVSSIFVKKGCYFKKSVIWSELS